MVAPKQQINNKITNRTNSKITNKITVNQKKCLSAMQKYTPN